MTDPPHDIKLNRQDRVLRVEWTPDSIIEYPLTFLRAECRCALCVDERTGQRILDPTTIPSDIGISDIRLVGHYALKISWTDGHDTGIYSWTLLQSLRPEDDRTASGNAP